MKEYVKLIRPQHWVKNALVFVPAFFAGELFRKEKITVLVVGFIAFSFIASVVYIFNDICDVEKDRLHEIKRKRPIASGAVSIKKAWIILIILLIIAEGIVWYLEGTLLNTTNLLLLTYLIINILYSKWLKNVPIVDIMILASGFVMRMIFGGMLIKCEVSQWLYLTVLMFSLYMGMGKRRNELKKVGTGETRTVLRYYTAQFLDKNMLMCMTLGVAFYAYWSAIIFEYKEYMIWTIPIVIAILMKYQLNIEADTFGDPIEVLISDKILWLLLIGYIILICLPLYVFKV